MVQIARGNHLRIGAQNCNVPLEHKRLVLCDMNRYTKRANHGIKNVIFLGTALFIQLIIILLRNKLCVREINSVFREVGNRNKRNTGISLGWRLMITICNRYAAFPKGMDGANRSCQQLILIVGILGLSRCKLRCMLRCKLREIVQNPDNFTLYLKRWYWNLYIFYA